MVTPGYAASGPLRELVRNRNGTAKLTNRPLWETPFHAQSPIENCNIWDLLVNLGQRR